ncbi:MAG TPA: hypothetical protein VEO19_07470 [Terriglobia bacterium]|nr:hypothetical protein [Terriglobia bacterium]
MPNAKRNRRGRARREPESAAIPSCAVWILRELAPLLQRLKLPRTRSAKHFRNAAIEVLEALRVLLDEAIERLRKEGKSEAELKRIQVSG